MITKSGKLTVLVVKAQTMQILRFSSVMRARSFDFNLFSGENVVSQLKVVVKILNNLAANLLIQILVLVPKWKLMT